MDLVGISKAFSIKALLKPKPSLPRDPRPVGNPGDWMLPKQATPDQMRVEANARRLASGGAHAKEIETGRAGIRLSEFESARLRQGIHKPVDNRIAPSWLSSSQGGL